MLKIKVPLVNAATLLVYHALPDLFVPQLALAGTIEVYSVSEALECYNLAGLTLVNCGLVISLCIKAATE